MKSALIAGIVAAVVASGSTLAATRLIDGNQIRPHTISEAKLTDAAVAALHGTPVTFSLARGPDTVVPASDGSITGQSIALCAAGSYPVGGGYFMTHTLDTEPVVVASTPDTSDGKTVDGWIVEVGNLTALGATKPLTYHSWATCESGGGPITLPG